MIACILSKKHKFFALVRVDRQRDIDSPFKAGVSFSACAKKCLALCATSASRTASSIKSDPFALSTTKWI